MQYADCAFLGRSHCKALFAAGATVVATDLESSQCETLASTLGHDSFFYPVDVTDPDSVKGLMDAVKKRTGSIDILVNNAAINDKVEDPATALACALSGVLKSATSSQRLERCNKALDN